MKNRFSWSMVFPLFGLILLSEARSEPPNIIIVMTDDLGYADVGFNGSQDITTPELDRLAAAGTVFRSAYVAHPFCGPSRMGLMAGRYPHAFGAPFNLPNTGLGIEKYNREGIPVEETMLSSMLQEAGYFTGAIGKWHLGIDSQFNPNQRGFDEFFGFLGGGHQYFPEHFQPIYQRQVRTGKGHLNDYITPLERNGEAVDETEYLTDAFSREAVHFVNQAATKDRPFFLYLAYNAPHTPLQAKEEDMAHFPGIQDEKRKTYAAMVYAVDRGVGQLVDALRKTNQFENTLIVFLSDNGGKLGSGGMNTPLREGKGSIYEGGYRVPMFFHWPKQVPAGKHFEHPVSALDFYPTFARLAGAELPSEKELDGIDIWDAFLADRNPRPGQAIFAMRHRLGFSDVGARRDQWKAVRVYNSPWKLFNLDEDPREQRDLSPQHPELLQELVQEAKTWSSTHTNPRWFDNRKAQQQWEEKKMPRHEETFALRKLSNKEPAPVKPMAGNALYQESFDIDPGYVGAKGPNDNNISFLSYGAGNSGFPHLQPGQFGGTSQYLRDTRLLGSTDGGQLRFGSHQTIYEKSRNRSYLTVIDTSKAVVGQYEVSFNVSDLITPPETAVYFHLWEGKDSHQGHVTFQVTYQTMLPELVPTIPAIRAKGAKLHQVLVENELKENGRFRLRFGLSEAGQRGDFLVLGWTQVKNGGTSPLPSLAVDNIRVELLPEPSSSSSPKALPAAPFDQSGEWELQREVSDEFNGSQINPRKWNNNPGSWGAWSWDEANTYQTDGRLHLQLDYAPHVRNQTKLFYKSGIIRSHHQMTYGYFEARIKGCDLFPGACPAFWMYSNGRQYTGEVRYCEVDFVELQMNELNRTTKERDPVNHVDLNLHLRLADQAGNVRWLRPGTNPELCAHHWEAPWDPRDAFHVYGCEVTPEEITWFIDGQEVASEDNEYWHLPMNVTLSLGLRHPHIGWVGQNIKPVPQAATKEGFPTTMEVDYVRVWNKR
ncbi:Hypothetical protein PBC10988_5090 [Planctomycetales bacterium 10988]|nr:Hypothetical protein PBC10988_5090 [Planctomycetales bacterium 10988]